MEIPDELIKRAGKQAEKEFIEKKKMPVEKFDIKTGKRIMDEKFNLSEKIYHDNYGFSIIDTKDVKEFIKLLKGLFPDYVFKDGKAIPSYIKREIDKLAGDKLI